MQDNSSRKGFLMLIMASNQPPDQLPNTLPQQQTTPPTSMSWHGVPILWQGNGYGFPPQSICILTISTSSLAKAFKLTIFTLSMVRAFELTISTSPISRAYILWFNNSNVWKK
jgi:hypothetical protein